MKSKSQIEVEADYIMKAAYTNEDPKILLNLIWSGTIRPFLDLISPYMKHAERNKILKVRNCLDQSDISNGNLVPFLRMWKSEELNKLFEQIPAQYSPVLGSSFNTFTEFVNKLSDSSFHHSGSTKLKAEFAGGAGEITVRLFHKNEITPRGRIIRSGELNIGKTHKGDIISLVGVSTQGTRIHISTPTNPVTPIEFEEGTLFAEFKIQE